MPTKLPSVMVFVLALVAHSYLLSEAVVNESYWLLVPAACGITLAVLRS